MKRFILGLICGIGLTATTAVYASDTIQAYLFKANYTINGESKALGEEYTTLNVNGHAYVPIRWIAESMGKIVNYDHDSQTVAINDTNLSKKLVIDKDFLSNAAKGKIKDIDFGIGASKKDVYHKWGEPHQTGSWQTRYDSWFDYYYFFSNPGESVGAIRVGGKTIAYTVDEIKKAIGQPKDEGINDVENGWYLYYETGNYQLFFNADSEKGQVRSLTLKQKEHAELRKLYGIPDQIKKRVEAQLNIEEGVETYFHDNGKTYVLLKGPLGQSEITVAALNQEGRQVTIEYYIGSSKKQENKSVQYSLNELNQEVDVVFKAKDFTQQAASKTYLSKDQALEIAKRFENNPDAIWNVRLIENMDIEINNLKETYTVWVVEASYPAGNKTVFYLDAVTGWQIMMSESEAFGGL
ncbi:DUF4309 domain-containing protein [Paenibacillus sedimenti]|uniref:DUF4309 domain-containing protein n=1 Tax=Paenibacillus sedimenti TaxID=2770274 RepID=A0A926QKS5_9BACL|nr:DUF4309 domain-containing protein [Paenibacillus sedimenti]MBD0381807.1 DUF4309 domain-containing protein [Paenibacillus sedimenti]